MSRRISLGTLPRAPLAWDPSSKEVWNKLIAALEANQDQAQQRRNKVQFVVKGTVSAPTTVDLASPNVTALTLVVANLLVALQGSDTIDLRKI